MLRVDSNGNFYDDEQNDTMLGVDSNGNFTYTTSPATTTKKKKNILDDIIDLGRFDDGYQPGDVIQTLLGTGQSLYHNLGKGAQSIGEGFIDWGANVIVSGALELAGDEERAKKVREWAQKDFLEESGISSVLEYNPLGIFDKTINAIEDKNIGYFNPFDKEAQKQYREKTSKNALFGEKGEQYVQGVGQFGGMAALSSAGIIPWQLTAFTTSMGQEMNNAFGNNANYGQALLSGIISGGVEVGSEYLFGGANKLLGMTSIGKDVIEKVGSKIGNKLVQYLLKRGIDLGGEGLEEVISGFGTAIGQKLTYMSDKELNELYSSEQALDDFLGGVITTGIANGGTDVMRISQPGGFQRMANENAFTGMTDNEQKIYDKLVADETNKAKENNDGKELTKKQIKQIEENVREEMSKGRVNVGYIEDALGYGDKVNYMINEAENSFARELTEEEKRDIENQAREEILNTMNNDYILQESYLQDQLRKSAFEVDMTKIDEKLQEFYQKAIDSGMLNNSRDTHNFVDMLAKIHKDKGIDFDFTNNEKLAESGFALDGKTINGYVTDNGITLNLNSKNALESTVGHEITHVLEGTDMYDALAKSIKEYAESKGEYAKRLKEVQDLYKDVENADATKELTADLVGDYLFTNQEFINHLTQNRNLFQKIYDEIKYLVKQVTAGSDEQRKLNKAVKMFEKAYREMSVNIAKKQANTNLQKTVTTQKQEQVKKAEKKVETKNKYKSIEEAINDNARKKKFKAASNDLDFFNMDYEDMVKQTALDSKNAIEVKTNEHIAPVKETKTTSENKTNITDNLKKYYEIKEKLDNATLETREQYIKELENMEDKLTPEELTEVFKNESKTLVPTDNDVKYSLSTDSNGRELSKQQQEYFKDSKVRDDEGQLEVVYHTTGGENVPFSKVQFNVFNPVGSEGYRYGNQVVNFFTNSQDMSGSYVDQNYVPADTSKIESMEQAEGVLDYYNSSDMVEYSIKEHDGKYELYDERENDILHTFNSKEDLFKNLTQVVQEVSELDENVDAEGFQYEGYLNITNPYIIDANGNEWNRIPVDNILEMKKNIKNKWDTPENQLKELKGDTLKELNKDLTKLGYQIIPDKYGDLGLFTKSGQLASDVINVNDILQEIRVDLENDLQTPISTNDVVFSVLAENELGNNYDGVIIKNVLDYGGASSQSDVPHNVYVAFNSNQFKNFDNKTPTSDDDIRYSLTQKVDSVLDDLTNEQYEYFKNTKAVNKDGELELVHHGTPNQFNVFDINKAGTTGVDYGNGFYFTNAIATARAFTGNEGGMYSTENEGVLDGYVNIEKPADRYYKTMTFKEFNDLYNALNENPNMYDEEMDMSNIDALLSDYGDIYNDKQSAIKQFYESYDDDVSLIDGLSFISNPTEFYKTLRDVTGYDGIIVENPNGWDNFEKYFIAFNPDQFKLKSNKTPTDNVDMNLSLSRNDEIAPVKKPNLTYGEDIALQDDLAPTGIDYSIKGNDIMDLIHQEVARRGGKKVELTKPVIAKEKSGARTTVDTLKEAFINKNVELDNMAKESGNKMIKITGDMLNNANGEAQYDITTAQTDNYGNEIKDKNGKASKGVQQLFEPAREKGLEAPFNDYLINYSNIDRWARGKGSQTPLDVSERLVADYEEKYPQFKKWAADVWNYSKNVRDNWLEAGMITQRMYDILSEAYPHYVPYISDTNTFDATMDKMSELKARPIKRAKGGATELFPVEDALTRYTFAQKRAYRQNELYKQIYNTLQTNPGQRGAEVGENYFNGTEPNLYRADDGNYLTAIIDGEERKIQISDELFRSLSNTFENQVKDIENRLSPVLSRVQWLNNVRRKMLTTWNPVFLVKNVVKDIQDGLLNSKHTAGLVENYLPGIKELFTNSTPEVRQFKALYGTDALRGQYDDADLRPKEGLKNNKFIKGLINANEIMELAPRYAEFKASLQAGDSLEEAMYNAREVTTNFARGGVITKALNRNGFTFLNASVQGFDKFIRNFSGENGAKGIASSLLKALMFGVAPAVFNELVFGIGDDKDEEYDALPDYVKDNYYLIKTGDGNFVRIPKGRMLSVFGSAARRTIELAEGEEDAFKGYLSNVNSQIGINNPEENNILAPLIQAYGSKNGTAWYGGNIVPTRLQDKPKGEQYDASTDKMSIWLGEHLGISPYKLNYVLDQYSGGIGDILLPMITDEAKSNGNILAPVYDQFVVDSVTDNKYVSDFYTKNDELKVQANSSKATGEDYLRNEYMKSISKEMSKLYAERREIQSNNSLTKAQKYEKSQAIKNQINQLAKTGLDNYNNVSVTGNYAYVDDMGYYKNAKGNWTAIDQKDITATESLGLNNREMSSYYTVKNDMYNIDQKYESQLKNATDEQKSELNAQKKVDIINSIKNADLPDSAKAVLYDKKYASTETLNAVLDCNIDFNSYLDLQAQNFTADKDKYGKTINGSKKRKVYSYINNLDMPYEQKIMLAKLEYKSDDTYNREIIDYLNNDDSISYQDMTSILEAMGFKVDEYGNITWE